MDRLFRELLKLLVETAQAISTNLASIGFGADTSLALVIFVMVFRLIMTAPTEPNLELCFL
jgi:hypothetical protein